MGPNAFGKLTAGSGEDLAMTEPQPGIFAQGTRSHYHLEFDVPDDVPVPEARAAISRLGEPAVSVGGFNLVVGLGSTLWNRLEPTTPLPGFRDFAPISGVDHHDVPATQHDVWVWVHGTGPDLALDAARAVTQCLHPIATLALEQPGFVYRDSRDLTGFIDGTANPPMVEAPTVALVPDDQPGEGGAFALTMRWVHDLEAFGQLSVPDQERVIGRTKPDSVEFDDDAKPPTAHIARVTIEEDGEELQLYRRSVPYGTIHEHGLFFVAFSADPSRFDKMLARMFGTASDQRRDRLTDFTQPVSAAYYFAPSLSALRGLATTT
jgi:porphyrinogen peroxidase